MMHRKTIEGNGLRVVNKDTHFMLIRTVMVRAATPDQLGGDKVDKFLKDKEAAGTFDKPQVVRCTLKTSESARVAHRKGDIDYFQRIFDDALAHDMKQKKALADREAELNRVEEAAKKDITIEQKLMKAPNGKVYRAVWVMPWWKRAMRWIKSKILPTKIVMPSEIPIPGMCGRCGKNPIDPSATLHDKPAVLCKQCFSDILDPRKPFDLTAKDGAQAAPASLTPTKMQPHTCPSPSCREGNNDEIAESLKRTEELTS